MTKHIKQGQCIGQLLVFCPVASDTECDQVGGSMSIFKVFKVTDWQNVMHFDALGGFLALLAFPIGTVNHCTSSSVPSMPTSRSWRTSVSGVVLPGNKFGLPLSHAMHIAESLFVGEFAFWTCYVFAAPGTNLGNSTILVRLLAANASLIRASSRTIYLYSALRAKVYSTMGTFLRRSFTPTMRKITVHRTELSIIPAVIRVEWLGAYLTDIRYLLVSWHDSIIAHNRLSRQLAGVQIGMGL